MTTFALGNPSVAFKLVKDKSMIVEYPSCVSLRERTMQIYDNEVADALIVVQADTPEVAVSGFVTAPEVSRINRTGQYFFINNRPIKSQALSFALRQGFEDALPQNRHPLAFLFFDIELSRVDVNVHPNKKEVRIAHEREVQKLLMESIRIALHGRRKFPRVHLAKNREEKEEWSSTHGGGISFVPYPESNGSLALNVVQEARAEHPYLKENQNVAALSAPFSEQSLELEEEDGVGIPRVIGQYHSTYIVADNSGELLIIDQHAAHERVMYEKTLDILKSAEISSQRQLIPLTFSLDYREQEALEEYLPLLGKLGFGINSLGRNTYSVDAIPAFLNTANPKQFLLDFVHDAIEGNPPRALEDKQKALAALIACKRKAVKGSSHLLREKAEHLVKDLFSTKQPLTCPHGRPTCIALSINDLERRFGRK
jgi:DNA mismatch repair protein MutL